MLQNYFTVAWRNLVRNKLHAFINVLGLSIGISSCLVIFLIVKYELSFDTFHKDKERIHRVVSQIEITGEWHKNSGVSAAAPFAVRNEVSGIETVVAFHEYGAKVSLPNGNAKPIRIESKTKKMLVEPSYFQLIQYEWLKGAPETALSEPNKVVLTEKQAKLYFGESEAIGRQILYGDSLWVTVAGIVKDIKQPSDFEVFTDFISFKSIESNGFLKRNYNLTNWSNTNGSSQLFVKLSQGTDTAQVNAQLMGITDKYVNNNEKEKFGRKLILQPLADLHFSKEYWNFARQANLSTLYGLAVVAVILLIIACINFINLETAQSIYRAKEVGIRKTLGSSRKHLIFQFLGETSMVTLCAILVSIFIAEQSLWLFSDYVPKGVTLDLLATETLLFFGSIWIVVSCLSGIYPAFVLSAFSPILAMKNQISASKANSRKAYLRKTLIITQFAISQAFIVGTLIVSSQIDFMINKDMGFKKDEIMVFYTPWFWEDSVKEKWKFTLIDRIKQLPEVQQISLSSNAIAENGYSTTVLKFKKGQNIMEVNAHRKSGDSSFVNMFSLQILAGRNINNSDTTKELLINEAYLKVLGFKNPQEVLNQEIIAYNGAVYPIVGVVKDFHIQPLHKNIEPTFIGCENKYATTVNVKLQTKGKKPEEVQAIVGKIEKLYNETYPETEDKFEATWFDDQINKFYESEMKMSKLMNTATFLAILISSLGLFGLVSFMVNQRMKEIGIRKVLGATISQITFLLSKDFLILVGIAFVIATPIAYYFTQEWLKDFAYKIGTRFDLFMLAGASAIVIALLTVSYKTIKAALENPVKSLRSE
jgi:ABC-type antimicrobial peptide transport system permease subunit